MFLLAIAGGRYIALGFVFYTTSQIGAGDMPWGVAKVLGGVVFSVGLILVVLTGAELFTSTTLTVLARASRRITTAQMLLHWAVVYLGNIVGAGIVVAICFWGGVYRNANGAWGTTRTHHLRGKSFLRILSGCRSWNWL